MVFNKLLFTTVLFSLAGCTHIGTVSGGSKPGEFYFVVQKSFLGIPGQAYIVRCVDVWDADGVLIRTDCQREIKAREASLLSPASIKTKETFDRLDD